MTRRSIVILLYHKTDIYQNNQGRYLFVHVDEGRSCMYVNALVRIDDEIDTFGEPNNIPVPVT